MKFLLRNGFSVSAAVRRALVLSAGAAGTICFAPVQAQQANNADEGTTLQEVVVTGSLIARTTQETPSPVQVLSAQDIQNSGYTNISDVLRNISANGAGTLTQSFSQAFAGGGAGVALRGLTVGGTLTLIDGHRMVGFPLTDDGERNFVDVTSIPLTAVDRIDVLKDGASSEYGSDAIAGVVNVILKPTYTGAQFEIEGGDSSHNDGRLLHADGIWGVGDLASDGWNAYVTAEYRHQGNILVANRSGNWLTTNWTGYGGANITPGAGTNGAVAFPTSLTGYLVDPNPASNAVTYLPGCSAQAQAADQCQFNWKGLELAPTTTQADFLGKFTVNLPGDFKSTTTASFFQSKSDQAGPTYNAVAAVPFTIIGFPPNGLPTAHIYPALTVPAGYEGTATTTAQQLVYSFPEVGLINTDFKTNTYRLVEDVDGHVAGWNIAASAGYMYALTDETFHNFLNPVAAQAALDNGYILGTGGPAAEAFAPTAQSTASSNLIYFNAHASHSILTLPGGDDMAVAVGAEWFEKKLNADAPASSVAGLQGMNDAWSVGSQADTAVFAELNVPLWKVLELNAAARYDHYNTAAGGETTPKIGFKYTPFEQLAVRGTFGRGFRAPSIPETNSGLAFAASSARDPILCPTAGNPTAPGNFPSQCQIVLAGVQTSSAKLQPEKTTSYTFGVVLEPIHEFSVSVDYYNIKINQDIISAFEAGGLGINAANTLRGPGATLPFVNPDGSITPAPTPVGLVLYRAYPYINASQDKTDGIDVDLKTNWDFGLIGKISGEVNYTHIISFTLGANGTTYQLAGTHGPSGISGDTGNPKDRAVVSLTWNKDPVSITATMNYISSFNVTDPSSGQPDCLTALEERAVGPYGGGAFPGPGPYPNSLCTVGSFTDFDFYGKVKVGDHLSVHGSILNAFNRPPPLDAVTYGGGGGQAYDAALHQAGAVGRFFTVGAQFTF